MQGINVQQHLVFTGTGQYKLACAPNIIQARNGNLICTWLSGGDNEPANDNCILISHSSDKGMTWSSAEVLLAAEGLACALTAWHVAHDGRIIALAAHWPYDKEYTEWFYFRIESSDNGLTWQKRENFSLHENHASITSPLKLHNGEYLLAGTFFDKRKRPIVGPVEKIIGLSEEEAVVLPHEKSLVSPAKFGAHLHGCCVFITDNENLTGLQEYGYIANRPLGLLEPTCIQLNDGRIVMLIRAEWGGRLWRSESSDNGRTWTSAIETDIPNPTTMATLRRLKDGRIALIHNAVGTKGTASVRNPLSIWVSNDEMQTWTIQEDIIITSNNFRPDYKKPGLDELAYPASILVDDRKLAFVYDRNRRDVLFVEVTIE